jgi:hypothetical protein
MAASVLYLPVKIKRDGCGAGRVDRGEAQAYSGLRGDLLPDCGPR